jgi:hypothetical protein
MSEQPTEGYAEQVNESLRDYEGFPAILSLLRRMPAEIRDIVAGDERAAERLRGGPTRTPDEERQAQDEVYQALADLPEMADIVKRVAELEDRRRDRASTAMFAAPEPDDVA